MIEWPRDSEIVTRLQDLQRQELTAVIDGDRSTMVLCRLMWVDLYRRATIREAAATTHHSELTQQCIRELTDPEPYWRKLQKARPLRMVVKREEYTIKLYPREPTTALWFRETLSCNHQVNLPADLFGSKRPGRRRCMQCARVILEEKNGKHSALLPVSVRLPRATPDRQRDGRVRDASLSSGA